MASLLVTTSAWDNLEELFCQTSNEAFKFDELIQVAPIRSARLYVKCKYCSAGCLVSFAASANLIGSLEVHTSHL